MSDHYFQRANPLWYIPIIGGLANFAIVTFWPSIMPFDSLGSYGQFTKYLAYNHHFSLVCGFWIAIFLHFLEAMIARRICQRLKIDAENSSRWFVQTLFLGYVSLGKLRKYAAKKR